MTIKLDLGERAEVKLVLRRHCRVVSIQTFYTKALTPGHGGVMAGIQPVLHYKVLKSCYVA